MQSMDVQPQVGGVIEISPHFGNKINILTDIGLKFGYSVQCNHTNDITIKSFKNIQNLPFLSERVKRLYSIYVSGWQT